MLIPCLYELWIVSEFRKVHADKCVLDELEAIVVKLAKEVEESVERGGPPLIVNT